MNRDWLLPWFVVTALCGLRADEVSLVRVGESWRYLPGVAEASAPVTAWRELGFDDSAWMAGPSGFSLVADEATALAQPASASSVFFRKAFTVADPQAVKWLVLRVDYSAGFVAFLNGAEIARRGLTNDPVLFDAVADDHLRGAAEDIDVSAAAPLIVSGTNQLAIQLHSSSNNPGTMVLVPELLANFQRGPFVQNATTGSIQVIWRTPVPADSVVEFGTSHPLELAVSNAVPTTVHVIMLDSLHPDTSYFYRVRSAAGGTQAISPTFCFRTLKEAGDITFAVLGDAGSGWVPQLQVARAIADAGVDLVLHTGDIVYWTFTPGLADTRCLSIYGPHMRSTPYFFTLGNHDLYAGEAAYLETFFLPTNSANGTEYFYSFDHGDAHFVSLFVPSLTPFALATTNGLAVESVQYGWLTNDLASSTKPWKFLFLHSPLFTSSAHRGDDADGNGIPDRLQLEELLVPLARQYGVQATFSGHDHNYERFVPTQGLHPLVTGGGGFTLFSMTERDSSSAQFWSRYHFLKATIHADTLRVQAVDPSGAVFDEMTIQRAVPPPQLWPSTWRTPVLTTAPADDGDGNVTGQTFDLPGTPIPALSGEFSNLGQCFVDNDGTNLYLGFRSCLINGDANIFLFIETPRLAGVTSMAGLGNGVVDPAGQGADGLDFLENLSFTNFAPGIACILGDEFADGQSRSFLRPALALDTGQGVFRLEAGFHDVPGARVQQFNSSPQRCDGQHQGTAFEQNADFIKVAIPLASLGSPNLGDVVKVGAVVGGPCVNTNAAAQTRQLDTGFLGVTLHGSGQGPVVLEGAPVRLALSPIPGDSDGDGLPDAWETAHGLNPLSAVGEDGASGDPDYDACLNWQEFIAGTDPRDPASRLRLDIAPIAPRGFRLSWPAVIGKTYQLEVADELGTGFVAESGGGFPRTATGTNGVYMEDLSTNSAPPRARAYRLRIVP